MKKVIVLAVAILTLTTGCDDDSLKQGTVYEKEYHHDYIIYGTQCMSRNKQGMCTFTIPTHQYVPESWEICIKDPAKDKRRNCMDVSEAMFMPVNVGDSYPKAQ